MAEKLYYSMGEVTEMFDVEASLIRYWCSQFSCLRPKRNAKGNRLFTPQDIERLKRIHHLLKEKKMTIEGAQKAMRKRNIEAEKNDSDITLLEQLQSLRAMLVDMRNNIGEPLPEELLVEEPLVEEKPAKVVAEVVPVVEEPVVEVAEEVATEVIAEPIEEAVETVAVATEEPVAEPVTEPVELTIEDIFEVKEEPVAEVAEPTVEEFVEPEVEVVAGPQIELPTEPVAAAGKVAEVAQELAVEVVEPQPQPQPIAKPKKKRAPRRKLIGEEGVVERPLFPFYEQTLF